MVWRGVACLGVARVLYLMRSSGMNTYQAEKTQHGDREAVDQSSDLRIGEDAGGRDKVGRYISGWVGQPI